MKARPIPVLDAASQTGGLIASLDGRFFPPSGAVTGRGSSITAYIESGKTRDVFYGPSCAPNVSADWSVETDHRLEADKYIKSYAAKCIALAETVCVPDDSFPRTFFIGKNWNVRLQLGAESYV